MIRRTVFLHNTFFGLNVFSVIKKTQPYTTNSKEKNIYLQFGNNKIFSSMELQIIQNKIYEIREQRVMLGLDLADIYETETKRLKEAVRRNINRFQSDFMFELTNQEYTSLRMQFTDLKSLTNDITNCDIKLMRFMIFTKH